VEHAFSIAAPAERVWLALSSPRWLMFTIPGATLTRENRGGFEGTLVVKVGSTAATYTGRVVWTERDEAAHRLVIRAHATDLRLDNGEESRIVRPPRSRPR
jgi:carbon monoxide dehydrogenase subunit G